MKYKVKLQKKITKEYEVEIDDKFLNPYKFLQGTNSISIVDVMTAAELAAKAFVPSNEHLSISETEWTTISINQESEEKQ